MQRPNFGDIKTGEEFNQWYWLKAEMVEICKRAGLPATGRKFDLRDRIMYALDHDGNLKPEPKKKKTKSKFNWAKSELSLETIITDNVSFGPNFRRFMKSRIGNRFSCHSDFMDWMKSNAGKTLADAVKKMARTRRKKSGSGFQKDNCR